MAQTDIRSLCLHYNALHTASNGQDDPDCLYSRLKAHLKYNDAQIMNLAAHGARDDHIHSLMRILYPELAQEQAILHNPDAIKLKLIINDAILITESIQKQTLKLDQTKLYQDNYQIQIDQLALKLA